MMDLTALSAAQRALSSPAPLEPYVQAQLAMHLREALPLLLDIADASKQFLDAYDAWGFARLNQTHECRSKTMATRRTLENMFTRLEELNGS